MTLANIGVVLYLFLAQIFLADGSPQLYNFCTSFWPKIFLADGAPQLFI